MIYLTGSESNRPMDATDIRIINRLIDNSRISLSDLSAEIHLSVSAVSERIRKLENEGIISRYTAVINYDRLGFDVTAYMDVSMDDPAYKSDFIEFAKRTPDIVECDYVAGDYDFILKINTQNTHSLDKVLTAVRSLKGVGRTKTTFVLSKHKEAFSPKLSMAKGDRVAKEVKDSHPADAKNGK